MKHVLEVDGVMLAFDNEPVLRDVYLKSATGRITGVLGRNGTGKSSLFRVIFGELVASSQSVRLNGTAYGTSRRSPQDIMYLPQHNFAPRHLRIRRVFDDFEVELSDLFHHFPEFTPYRNARMSALSSGQRRIVEAFVVLTSKTKFCILDEPFSQLMPIHVEELKKVIRRERTNKGIILSDHMYRDIVDLSDELYLIQGGKVHLIKGEDDLERLGYLRS
ncbi:ATP-binding cassette domain-containing protein [Lewinella sp. W8]|uniref:ATP-binding cassette domain-containing protein n=1 Tax=Lewinella sp. W8 TaxID=2528208 RepID=UPI001067337B|nr:ATP-binding cassette domain-containing protein [Lewinella sp. W8]MTB53446.1 ATP-binding cassette domain-containing protein [Lewinella sp. W8]